jgi:hypothetical protein
MLPGIQSLTTYRPAKLKRQVSLPLETQCTMVLYAKESNYKHSHSKERKMGGTKAPVVHTSSETQLSKC